MAWNLLFPAAHARIANIWEYPSPLPLEKGSYKKSEVGDIGVQKVPAVEQLFCRLTNVETRIFQRKKPNFLCVQYYRRLVLLSYSRHNILNHFVYI